MTRHTVAIADLPSEFKSLFDKRIEPVRREAEGLCSKVQDWLTDIKDTGSKLLRENVEEDAEEASKSSISSADKFGQKIIDLVEGVKPPNEMTYDDLVDYTNALRNLQSQIVHAASIWIPKLPLQLKRTIRELEAKMKLLGFSVNSLENHVGGKHRQVDKLEKIIEDSKQLVVLHQDLKDLDGAIKTHEENIGKLLVETRDVNQAIEQLDLSDISRRMTEQEKRLQSLRTQISEIFQPLEKPVEKLLKTTDSKNGLITSTALETLRHYLNDPADAIEVQKNSSQLRSALQALQNVLIAGSIELKESRVRNALKSISEICTTDRIETLRQSYHQLRLEHDATLSSKEAVETTEKKRELENRKQLAAKEKSRLNSDLQTLQSRRDELALRISRLKADLEERSRSTAGEDIEILDDNEKHA